MQVNPFLQFNGTCEEAFRFYARCLGGEIVMLMRYGEAPMPAEQKSPQMAEKVIHARLVAQGAVLMGSDAPPQFAEKPQGFTVSVSVDDAGEAERLFHALVEGGVVRMPIGETFWAQRFGMLVDRYGTPWMINCEKKG